MRGMHYSFLKDTHVFRLHYSTRFYSGFNIFFCFLVVVLLSYTNWTHMFCLGFFFFIFIWDIKCGQHVISIAQWCYVSVPRVLSELRNSWGFWVSVETVRLRPGLGAASSRHVSFLVDFFFIRMKYNFYLSSFRMTVLQNHCTPRDIHYFL